jgi:hypothetical protein
VRDSRGRAESKFHESRLTSFDHSFVLTLHYYLFVNNDICISMIGARALRTCSVCRDKLRAATISRAPALARSIVGTSARYHVESSRIGIDDSVFGFSSSTTTTNRISNLSVGNEQTTPEEDEDWAPREERRSPAAVFGSKRVGLETIPRRMDENIQSEINSKLGRTLHSSQAKE